jgi:molybdopterin molybdotransferase
MIEVAEALERVLSQARPKPARRIPLDEGLDLVLAEDVASDVDSPPHDKALMDGYAVIAADLASGAAELDVLEEVTAGEVPTMTVRRGAATRIMTGAPLPPGADAVVMVEQTEPLPATSGDAHGRVRISAPRVGPGQNIMRRAASMRKGETVVRTGTILRPIEIGLLAEVGRAAALAIPRPEAAVLSTGNELVPPDVIPSAGRIRNSNGPMLQAQVMRAGGSAIDLGIGRDDEAELRRLVAVGLERDVLVLSGGVSAGVLDLVPRVLAAEGVEQVFHKVNLKPGKPVWFGVRDRGGHHDGGHYDGGHRTLVFGLPGNPVSSLVCFELFVRPALAVIAGRSAGETTPIQSRLTIGHVHRGDRPTYWPAKTETRDGESHVTPLDWRGSGDLFTLAAADCLICFPPGDRPYAAGEPIDIRPL